ncbi:hypothetical protein K505DRAFT_306760 [Melanomma pulvis-pyrius CBS 109.77]|uniref:Kinetochore protein fta4 n=1 Tax=Melanomma pulvis-pyrius CBS 109.77 TaxID=1314802 RepID=A0A6A6X965_9PLEO|nr:hypothetical protein K505DRAFT_306760 [Melanomma pulvis-pyrius CBS 109.77]
MTLQGTVVDRKRQFLQSQKQILKRGIPATRELVTIANQGGISSRVLTDALRKVNRDLSRHARLVHSRQMTEHVVEQIDVLYWEAGAADIEADADTAIDVGGEDKSTLYQSDDLTLDKNISKLPATWDTSADILPASDDEVIDQDAYIHAVARLQGLSARRLTLEQKLNTYRTLLSLLEPYRKPKENIQPNLVGRDGPLVSELMKTRTLAIRVTGRVVEKFGEVEVPEIAQHEDMEMAEDNEKAKLEQIMASW